MNNKLTAILLATLAILPAAVFAASSKTGNGAFEVPLTSTATTTSTTTFGFVITNDHKGKNGNMVNVVVKNGIPGTYDVVLSNSATTTSIGTLTVKSNGHGHFHFNGNIAANLNGFVLQLEQSGTAIYQALLKLKV